MSVIREKPVYILSGHSIKAGGVAVSARMDERKRIARIEASEMPSDLPSRDEVVLAARILVQRMTRVLPGWIVLNKVEHPEIEVVEALPVKSAGPSREQMASWSGV
jgi:hypothetical protein